MKSTILEAPSKSKTSTEAFQRYKFDANISNEVMKRTMKQTTDNWHGALDVIEDWAVIFLFILFSEFVQKLDMSPTIKLMVYFLTVLVIGARQRGLADCLHQASHQCLASNKKLNFLLGTVFSGYTVFQSFYGYEASHVRNHHPHLGTQRDPDYVGLIENGICGENRTSENVKRYLKNLFTPQSSWKYLMYLFTNRIVTKDDKPWETVFRFLYLGSLLTLFVWSECCIKVALYWIIPFVTSNMWIGSFIELLEHYPMIETAPKVDILMTRNRICGWLWNFFFGVHNENYHLIHHLFPKVPEWNFHEVHTLLLEDPLYARLHMTPGWKALFKDVVEVDDCYKVEKPAKILDNWSE